jgi:hypothetical protein
VIIKEIITTINNLKERLKGNEQFNGQDLTKLRDLYSKVTKLVNKNRQEDNFDTSEEMSLVQQMIDIINSYGDESNIFAGIQKRITRAALGSPVANVVSYYYCVGKDKSYQVLKI